MPRPTPTKAGRRFAAAPRQPNRARANNEHARQTGHWSASGGRAPLTRARQRTNRIQLVVRPRLLTARRGASAAEGDFVVGAPQPPFGQDGWRRRRTRRAAALRAKPSQPASIALRSQLARLLRTVADVSVGKRVVGANQHAQRLGHIEREPLGGSHVLKNLRLGRALFSNEPRRASVPPETLDHADEVEAESKAKHLVRVDGGAGPRTVGDEVATEARQHQFACAIQLIAYGERQLAEAARLGFEAKDTLRDLRVRNHRSRMLFRFGVEKRRNATRQPVLAVRSVFGLGEQLTVALLHRSSPWSGCALSY